MFHDPTDPRDHERDHDEESAVRRAAEEEATAEALAEQEDFSEIAVHANGNGPNDYSVRAWCVTCNAMGRREAAQFANGLTTLPAILGAAIVHLASAEHRDPGPPYRQFAGGRLRLVPKPTGGNFSVSLPIPEQLRTPAPEDTDRCPTCGQGFQGCNADGCAGKPPGWRGWPVPEEQR